MAALMLLASFDFQEKYSCLATLIENDTNRLRLICLQLQKLSQKALAIRHWRSHGTFPSDEEYRLFLRIVEELLISLSTVQNTEESVSKIQQEIRLLVATEGHEESLETGEYSTLLLRTAFTIFEAGINPYLQYAEYLNYYKSSAAEKCNGINIESRELKSLLQLISLKENCAPKDSQKVFQYFSKTMIQYCDNFEM
ncbi:MAG: hypothetical protein Q8M03_01000, partial [Legionella sp.]|nr:hypothetical protein [Legionella sp.]